MLVEPAVDHLLGGLLDEPGLVRAEFAEFEVRAGGGELDQAHGAQERAAETVAADGEIQHRALGAGTVKRVGGHGHLAHAVLFNPGGRGRHGRGRPSWESVYRADRFVARERPF